MEIKNTNTVILLYRNSFLRNLSLLALYRIAFPNLYHKINFCNYIQTVQVGLCIIKYALYSACSCLSGPQQSLYRKR